MKEELESLKLDMLRELRDIKSAMKDMTLSNADAVKELRLIA